MNQLRLSLAAMMFVLLLFGVTTTVSATPDPSTWVRVTPLGLNARSYFYLETIYNNPGSHIPFLTPGSHYSYSETLNVVRRDIRTARLQERVTLRNTEYTDVDTYGDWKSQERPTAGFNLTEYLTRHQVQTVFPVDAPKELKLIDGSLVELMADGQTTELSSEKVLRQQLQELPFGWMEFHAPKIRAVYNLAGPSPQDIPSGRLVLIESGYPQGETNFYQQLVYVRD